MAGLSGLPQGEGLRLSPRIVDDAASGSSRARAWTSRGARLPWQAEFGTLCKILNEQEVKPHKVRCYLERRDPEFKAKMAEVLCVYPRGQDEEDGRIEEEAERRGGDHLL